MQKLLLLLLLCYRIDAQIIFNEFMIDAEDENSGEFIEVINTGNNIVKLTDYYLCDPQDTDAVISFPDSLLAPGEFGLILDPDYSGEYDSLIPVGTPRFSIEDSRFGMYGISNSSSKCFAILEEKRETADSYTTGTPLWPVESYTIERFIPNEGIWLQSLYPGGTPGARNSIGPKDRDLKLYAVECSYNENKITIDIVIENTGLEGISTFNYGYIVDTYGAGHDLCDTLHYQAGIPLQGGDSCRFSHSSTIVNKGSVRIRAFLAAQGNIRDTLKCNCHIPLDPNDIIITEFVCKTGDRFGTEYVEFCSRADLPVQFMDLQFADQTGAVILDSSYILYPDSIMLIAASPSFYHDFPSVDNVLYPSAWRSLNNQGDIISLLNPSGSIICKLRYDSDWSIPGDCAMFLTNIELDYRDPLNWEVTYTGSPGRKNRSSKKLHHLSSPEKNSFFTAGDTLSLSVINDGYFPLEEKEVLFRTARGSETFILPASEPGDTFTFYPDTAEMFFPGTQSCELFCPDTGILYSEFRYYYPYDNPPCYFNEFLFDHLPEYGQTEFIELECNDLPCDLDNWILRVNNHERSLAGRLLECYTVLTAEDEHPGNIPRDKIMAVDGFPVLPNGGALCYLYDPMGRIIDSCDLRGHQDLLSGKSLEKQYGSISSGHAGIWHASVSPQGMSPGQRNSISILPGYRDQLSVFPAVYTPGEDEKIAFNIDSENGLSYCELICYNLAGQEIIRFERSLFHSHLPGSTGTVK
ncbi:MAG: hypothetical protein U5N56_07500 [Candidatus Marinimicrobia bacterium]|nr:hypothetical protein [Candidatus Neomarinimicrobiota bacterium]